MAKFTDPPATKKTPKKLPVTAEFTLTIDPEVTKITHDGVTVPFKMDGPDEAASPHVFLRQGSFQKNNNSLDDRGPATTIRVDCERAEITITITGKRFVPVGIAFRRADDYEPGAIACRTGGRANPSPFSQLQIEEHELVFTDEPLGAIKGKWSGWNTGGNLPHHITYQFIVFVQDLVTGKVGIIDPEVENEN